MGWAQKQVRGTCQEMARARVIARETQRSKLLDRWLHRGLPVLKSPEDTRRKNGVFLSPGSLHRLKPFQRDTKARKLRSWFWPLRKIDPLTAI